MKYQLYNTRAIALICTFVISNDINMKVLLCWHFVQDIYGNIFFGRKSNLVLRCMVFSISKLWKKHGTKFGVAARDCKYLQHNLCLNTSAMSLFE